MSLFQNPFVVGRCVFFVIVIIVNIIAFISATIHIAVLTSHEVQASFLAFAELFIANARTAQVKFECAWTVILSIMQFAASIDVTVNGPPAFCRGEPLNGAVCATSSILLPTTWLAFVFLFSYCVLLIGITMVHRRDHPAIWTASVYSVPWFQSKGKGKIGSPSQSKNLPPLPPLPRASISTTNLPIARTFVARSDPEKQGPSGSGPSAFYNLGHNSTYERPPWAKRQETRRGVDSPFFIHRKDDRDEEEALSEALSDAVSILSDNSSSRFVEMGMHRLQPATRNESGSGAAKPAYPQNIYNPDKPIPLPHRSQWMRADHHRASLTRTTSTNRK
ncbi:hypothetical protein OE88DRAFT_984928 [Heliocybe sulcata]|uniref:Transmembrane protein n=1 Tax=Heliocybe sulcata TaxID=5364 RepID=A0A5C3NBF2_9AGAM|nr:hypothetical protein OE88DRAFT_984928 [Heliocybe sulcata]